MLRLALLVALPLAVHAGIVSAGARSGADGSAAPVADARNSQTLALLESVPNPDAPSLARGGGDIIVVDDSALLPESGPAGTIADVVGQRSDRISVYVVREGDTLSQIATMFDVSVNTIRWANDITRSTSIQPGDTLIILPISGVRHTVADGDTLAKIAKKYEADLDEIANYNGIDPEGALAVGSIVIVPHGEIAPPPTPVYSAPSTASGPTYAGYFMRPIAGGVHSQGIHGYNGVDLATYYGAEIYASAAGRIIIAKSGGWNGGYGSYVVILHDNGSQTLYAHNSANAVSVGQYVTQGQVIGYVGNSGRSTGSHVHFEIRGAGITNPF